MFGLNETARIYRYMGQSGGKPSYSANPVVFRCRTQPEKQVNSGMDAKHGYNYVATVRIFAQGIQADSGDRIVTENGRKYDVVSVEEMRGRSLIHHLEIVAVKSE